MLKEPPHETIESITRILLACERKGVIRDFAGHAVGKRRKLIVCKFIAERIAPRYLYPIDVRDGERKVGEKELIDLLEQVLRSIPDEQAFLLASRDDRHRRQIGQMIARRMSKIMRKRYTLSQIDNSTWNFRVHEPGPSWGDEALAEANRRAELRPRYRWRRTAGMFEPDFTGFDGELAFGRIWYAHSKGPEAWWQWECLLTMDRQLNSLPQGGADIARQAARDVEDHYDILKRLNGLME
ncbi:hypothetical protein [Rhizobium sp. GCM10022189]|uniref:hypothetical protein n=1 Tax=Rhizobium sp. GCM10022189 TaxID=3252654 RepID=UPI003621A580